MDYNEIVLNGWFEACNLYELPYLTKYGLHNNCNEREAILEDKRLAHLKAYFNKNAKQATAEGIPRDVFFNACRATLGKMADQILTRFYNKKNEFLLTKDAAKDGRIKATKAQIERIEKQLQNMTVYTEGISLLLHTKARYKGNLHMIHLEMIGLALDEAEKIDLVQQPKPQAEPKKLSTREAALLLYALQAVYKAEYPFTANRKELTKQVEKLTEFGGFSKSIDALRNTLYEIRKGTTNEKRTKVIELLKQAGKYPKAIELLQKEMRSASEENALQNEV